MRLREDFEAKPSLIWVGALHVSPINQACLAARLQDIEIIEGDVMVEAGVTLRLPRLRLVTGHFVIHGNATAAMIDEIGGNCYLKEAGQLDAAKLMRIGGGLYLYPDTSCRTPELRRVASGVSINVQAQFPELVHVGGGLVVNADAELSKLKRVEDYVYVFVPLKLTELTSIGGDLVVYPDGKLCGGNLRWVGARLVLQGTAELSALTFVGTDLFVTGPTRLPALRRVCGQIDDASRSYLQTAPSDILPLRTVMSRPDAAGPPGAQCFAPKENPWRGRRWTALGSSVTEFGAYTQPLASIAGLELENLAVGGGTLTTSASAGPAAIHDQIALIPDGTDLVTVEAGMVDFRANACLGSLYDTTLDTFYGAVYRTILDIQAIDSRLTILFLTPFGTQSPEFVGQWNAPNERGDRYDDYVLAIQEVCRWCGVPAVECGTWAGLSGPAITAVADDGLHLNPAGGIRLAQYIYGQLRLIPPFPELPGTPWAGGGRWNLHPRPYGALEASGGRAVICEGGTLAQTVRFQLDQGFAFGVLWLTQCGHNAVEFIAAPLVNNSLWIVLGEGPQGWIGVGDFNDLGCYRVATFDAKDGAVRFASHLSGAYSINPNRDGMRWRVCRRGDLVEIFQQRPVDDMWIEVSFPISLASTGCDPGYFETTKIGVLAPHSLVRDPHAGTWAPGVLPRE